MPANHSKPDRSARLVALAVGIPFFLMLAVLLAMPFMAGDETTLLVEGPVPTQPGAERGGVRFSGTVHRWSMTGSVVIDAERQAQLFFQLRGPDGNPPQQPMQVPITFVMPDHDMSLTVTAEQTGRDSFATVAPLPMSGNWQMRVTFSEVTGVLQFDVRG
ncbi:AAA family ATPase [Halomonas sp. DQ26W]|uniref:AAA family ATPase n=1 Tax=Halomonas sp. DQ26W TaxID=2282311 RepID=UPI000DF86162|nr:AAA family ATPase [Halomonas sp. DQ26W]RDB44590.1 AAA family ATPase [Halomonas sp. DQ26W]